MPRVSFTPNLARHLQVAAESVEGSTVRESLERVFDLQPALRDYVLDDQSRLRKHVTIFIDGDMVADRRELSDAVGGDSEVFVVQALSGG